MPAQQRAQLKQQTLKVLFREGPLYTQTKSQQQRKTKSKSKSKTKQQKQQKQK